MKKIFLILLISTIYAFANVGKITAVKGEVYIVRDAQQIVAKSGSILELKDKVQTKAKAKALVLFNDNTSITVGNNSSLSVNEFVMDLKTPSKSKTSFGFGKGVFRTITGKIGKINPSGFKIKTKSASIGIRGTIFEVTITPKNLVMDVQSGATWLLPDTQQIPTEVPEGSVLIFDDTTGALTVMLKAAFEKKKKEEEKGKSDPKSDDSGEGKSPDSPKSAPIDMESIGDLVDKVEKDNASNLPEDTYTYETMCKSEGSITCDHYANFDYGYKFKNNDLDTVYSVQKVITDTTVIDDYITDMQSASYDGKVAALVNGTTKASGTIHFDFSFYGGGSTFSGNTTINNVAGNTWTATFNGNADNNSFSTTGISGSTDNGSITGNIYGSYYGIHGESVGGFLGLSDTVDTVSGVFGAQSEELPPQGGP